MKKRTKGTMIAPIVAIVTLIGFAALMMFLLQGQSMAMVDTKGLIAEAERNLIVKSLALMLIVVVPVYVLLAAFSWRYRASNVTAKYLPNWEHNKIDEIIWWTVPFMIIAVLSVMTWKSTHELDPYRAIASDVKPMTIQAVALDWKWLFIYPEQGIATVNFVEFPVNTPVEFKITADAPMNSFSIPQLGGQIYAMPGAATELNLIANETGTFRGASSNFSGRGFAGMRFAAKAVSQDEFTKWAGEVSLGNRVLDTQEYNVLAKPNENQAVIYYAAVEDNLFNNIIMKFMMPMKTGETMDYSKSSASHAMMPMEGMWE